MAVYPCDLHTHRYPDPQRSIYLSYACNDLVQTRCLRLCPRDFQQELAEVGKHLAFVEDSSQVSSTCERCGQDKNCAIFAKVYDLKSDPVQYASDFCGPCAEDVLRLLSFANGRAMAGR